MSSNPEISLFIPGRLCLFGEHSDWAGRYSSQNADIPTGQAIVTGINLGIYAHACRSEKLEIRSFDENGEAVETTCEMHTELLRKRAKETSFFCYCCGVAAYMRENHKVGGMKLVIDKVTLPMKKGLSSSAAICVLVARAFNRLYNLHLSTRGEMMCAYYGERLTNSRCGRLDQACAYGEQPVLMEFSDETVSVRKLAIGKTLHWVFADLKAGKDTRKILTGLNSCYPYAQNDIAANVQTALGKDNQDIIRRAAEAMNEGSAEKLGALMNEAQQLFDSKVAPACPDELTAPTLHSLLNDPNIQNWIYGGKGVGSQGDGSAQFIAKDSECQRRLIDYINGVRKMQAFSFDIRSGGKVRKAVIPIAGYGTRMYPETHFIKKAFLPVVDSDGAVKPVLLSLMEELDSAGIEEFIIIIGKDETDEYRRFFDYDIDRGFSERLPENVRHYYDKIRSFGQRTTFVEQKEKRGFGHAVYQAHELLGGEPALLTLGDFLYRSSEEKCCAAQMIEAFNRCGGNTVIGIKPVELRDVCHYGVIKGAFSNDDKRLMNVTDMAEKPTEAFAREHLAVERDGTDEYFITFGQYVLTDEIFRLLAQQIAERNEQKDFSEIDLTACLRKTAENGRLMAFEVNGISCDVGIPEQYYRTFVQFHDK